MVLIMHPLTADGAYSMLRITTEKRRGKTVLAVEGRLAGPWVGTLEQCWRELHAASPSEKFHIDLCGVSFIDAAGKVSVTSAPPPGNTSMRKSRTVQACCSRCPVTCSRSAR